MSMSLTGSVTSAPHPNRWHVPKVAGGGKKAIPGCSSLVRCNARGKEASRRSFDYHGPYDRDCSPAGAVGRREISNDTEPIALAGVAFGCVAGPIRTSGYFFRDIEVRHISAAFELDTRLHLNRLFTFQSGACLLVPDAPPAAPHLASPSRSAFAHRARSSRPRSASSGTSACRPRAAAPGRPVSIARRGTAA